MAVGKYHTHVQPKLLLVEAWARNGLTLEQIADNLGIAKSTLFEYQKDYSDFSDALKKGKEVIDTMVENALLKAALGYDFEEEALDKMGDIHSLKKVAHPNTTALIFWLKNRNAKDWRDKQELEHSGDMSLVVNRRRMNPDASVED